MRDVNRAGEAPRLGRVVREPGWGRRRSRRVSVTEESERLDGECSGGRWGAKGRGCDCMLVVALPSGDSRRLVTKAKTKGSACMARRVNSR